MSRSPWCSMGISFLLVLNTSCENVVETSLLAPALQPGGQQPVNSAPADWGVVFPQVKQALGDNDLEQAKTLLKQYLATPEPGFHQTAGKLLTEIEKIQDRKHIAGRLHELSDAELLALASEDRLPDSLISGHAELQPALQRAIRQQLPAELARRWQGKPRAEIPAVPAVPAAQPVNQTEPVPVPAPVPAVPVVQVETVAGQPFGVGLIEVAWPPGGELTLYPDQPVVVSEAGDRILYPVVDREYRDGQPASSGKISRLRAWFLIRGEAPLQWRFSAGGQDFLKQQPAQLSANTGRRAELLQGWWGQFSGKPEDLSREQRLVKDYLIGMLSRRLNLTPPAIREEQPESLVSAGLEQQFEQAVSLLFGFDSIELAMQDNRMLLGTQAAEEATIQMPQPLRLAAITVPDYSSRVSVEPLALHVPAECFYLRAGGLSNYLWFRQLLLGWGGSLDDIVATPALEYDTRARLERQLALRPDQVVPADFDNLISDLALIGCDPLFREGAAVGLVFETRSPEALQRLIARHRGETLAAQPAAAEQEVVIAGRKVSFLSAPDHSVRSFYVIDGKYHLVTNCRYLVARFLEAGAGKDSLGRLEEFRYARSQARVDADTVAFLYLSDPFFRNMISPHYRIELTRRKLAANDLKHVELARLAARAEGVPAETVQQLIAAKLLPAKFTHRPDESQPVIQGAGVVDSLRGAAGVFLPVPDVPPGRITRSEYAAYQNFTSSYQQEWRRVDPVTLVVSRRENNREDQDQVSLEMIVTPYALQHYAFLRNHLGPGGSLRVAPLPDDLLSLQTTVKVPGSPDETAQVYLGLRDAEVPFAMRDGEVRLQNQSSGATYARTWSYVAVTPARMDVLRLLQSFVGGGTPSAPSTPSTPSTPSVAQGVAVLTIVTVQNLIYGPQTLFKRMNEQIPLTTRNGWAVVAANLRLRQSAPGQLALQPSPASHQVSLRLSSLEGSRVEPYIQAYTYMQARRASAANAELLGQLQQWFHVPPAEVQATAQAILGARVICPLGGSYVPSAETGARWTGTAWPRPSLYSEHGPPDTWRFPFLRWMKGMDLKFDLSSTTLEARVDLTVSRAAETPLKLARMHQVAAPAAVPPAPLNAPLQPLEGPPVELPPVSPPAPLPAATWLLGIAVVEEPQGLKVASVYDDSPARRADLRTGDEILSVNHRQVKTHAEIVELLKTARSGNGRVEVRVRREKAVLTCRARLAPTLAP